MYICIIYVYMYVYIYKIINISICYDNYLTENMNV